jgi:hypothetical protein
VVSLLVMVVMVMCGNDTVFLVVVVCRGVVCRGVVCRGVVVLWCCGVVVVCHSHIRTL